MSSIRIYASLVLFLLIFACVPETLVEKAPLESDGHAILYLQPMPQQASRLRFVIDEISAVHSDGRHIALRLFFNEVKGAALTTFQKRLASGPLPEGRYSGISIKIKKAFLLGEEGESALLVPAEAIEVSRFFEVSRKNATALFLSFGSSGAVTHSVSFTPVFSLAVSGKGLINLTGYASNSGSNTISVFNKKTVQVTDTLATGRGPKGMALDEQRARVYVAASKDDAIEVIDVAVGKIINRVTLNFGDEPVDLALTPDGKTLVSVNRGSNTVSIIDAVSEIEVRRIRVGERPVTAVVDPVGLKAFIMNSLSNTVSVVDLFQQDVSMSIGIEGAPLRGTFNRDGDQLYVICTDSPNLFVIDPQQFSVSQKIFIGLGAVSIKFDTRTGLVMVGKKNAGEISIIDPFSAALIDSIATDGMAAFMAIDTEENALFAAFPERGVVAKINLTSKKNMAEIEVGEAPYAVIVMGEQ